MDKTIKKLESNRGKPVFVLDGNKFCQAFIKIKWRNEIANELPKPAFVFVFVFLDNIVKLQATTYIKL